MTIDGLMERMRSAFYCRSSMMERRRKFEGRTCNSSENFADYYHKKRILVSQISIDDDDLINYLIEGKGDMLLRNQARIQHYDSAGASSENFRRIIIQSEAIIQTSL
ncbi:unnamed protein product [Lasius platythorax]|uniref:Uncharacterized protein n=1 Tax=Lasius platythorax TaxID=488582 RepID=A0AAV2NG80_9HYME